MSSITRLQNKVYEVLGFDAWGNRQVIPNDFNTELVETKQNFPDNSIDGSKVGYLNVNQLIAGSFRVDTDASSSNYVAGSTGWKIFGNGDVEFASGYFRGDISGATGTFSGALNVGANAWHVDASGNMWWGSSATYAGATIKISSAGVVNFTQGNFSGSLAVGTNGWHVDTSGNMWWGSSSTYAGATIKIGADGTVNFTTGNFTGDISGASGTFTGDLSGSTITGSTIIGGTIETASSGQRVVIDSSNYIYLYSGFSGGTLSGKIYGWNGGGIGQGMIVDGLDVVATTINDSVVCYANSSGFTINSSYKLFATEVESTYLTGANTLRFNSTASPLTDNGSIYFDGTHFYGRIAGAWKQLDN